MIILDKIPDSELTYICCRNQHQAHNLLLIAIKGSGLSHEQIAQKAGVEDDVLTEIISRPRDVGLGTLSRILYAASGASLSLSPAFPEDDAEAARRAAKRAEALAKLSAEEKRLKLD